MMRISLFHIQLAVLLFQCLSLGICYSNEAPNYTFLHDATTASGVSYYDYIIIGGGTAGCPLAATLSERHSVLLIERGDSPYGNPNIINLAYFGTPLADSSPESPAQQFTSEDGVYNTRARILGGGTSINAGFYSRASQGYVNKAGWDGKLVNESYRWVEDEVAFKPAVIEWQSAVKDGLLEAGVTPDNGFTYDHIVGTKVGGTIFDQNGHRHTAADLLKYADPKRLTVLLKATVHKILFKTEGKKSKPTAYGVVFTDASGVEHIAYLKKGLKNEIILSAGALGSPQLLMLSGVGPSSHLKSHDIPVVLDQPMVGQDMADNPLNVLFVPSPVEIEVSLVQVVGITKYGSYIEALSGLNFLSFIIPQQNSGIVEPETPLRKLYSVDDEMQPPGGVVQGGFIGVKVDGPVSSGHLELRNKSPYDNPSVTFNYFKDPADLNSCVESMKIISKVIESKALSGFAYPNITVQTLMNEVLNTPANLRPRHENASVSLEQFCKDTVLTIWHYHGGCQVGKVVDSDYKVLGVDALRVVDGSTFLSSPGTNPQATVMMLGRYVGVKILEGRLKQSDRYEL